MTHSGIVTHMWLFEIQIPTLFISSFDTLICEIITVFSLYTAKRMVL